MRGGMVSKSTRVSSVAVEAEKWESEVAVVKVCVDGFERFDVEVDAEFGVLVSNLACGS